MKDKMATKERSALVRKRVYAESTLPYSFNYKIRNAFGGGNVLFVALKCVELSMNAE